MMPDCSVVDGLTPSLVTSPWKQASGASGCQQADGEEALRQQADGEEARQQADGDRRGS
jgi:hypothetical protein